MVERTPFFSCSMGLGSLSCFLVFAKLFILNHRPGKGVAGHEIFYCSHWRMFSRLYLSVLSFGSRRLDDGPPTASLERLKIPKSL